MSPSFGDVIADVGALVSVDAVAAVRPACSVAGCTPMSANRFTVACCIAESGVGAAAIVGSVETPRPLDRARVEDQRAARRAVQRHRVRRRARRVGRAGVLEDLRHVDRGRRQIDLAGRSGAVVEVLVPLVAERVIGQRRGRTFEVATWCCARAGAARRPGEPGSPTCSS